MTQRREIRISGLSALEVAAMATGLQDLQSLDFRAGCFIVIDAILQNPACKGARKADTRQQEAGAAKLCSGRYLYLIFH